MRASVTMETKKAPLARLISSLGHHSNRLRYSDQTCADWLRPDANDVELVERVQRNTRQTNGYESSLANKLCMDAGIRS